MVLGTSIVRGDNAIFDVGILQLAGVSQDLYRVSDYAFDVLMIGYFVIGYFDDWIA